MPRRLLPVLVALALAAVAVVAWAGGSTEPGSAPERLPDLDQAAPYGLDVTRDKARGGYRLGFGSAVDNLGAGPLIISGRRPRGRVRTMTADQVIERAGDPYAVVEGVGTLRYVRSPDHEHWHLLGFERYELRRPGEDAALVSDRKTGFCLGDRYAVRRAKHLPRRPADAVYTRRCGLDDPGRLALVQGISVGYGDEYEPNLEGQSLSLKGVEDGRYQLVHRVNVDRALRESDYANNAASLLIGLRRRQGRPSVRVLRRCPAQERCPRGRT
jgi:Lysyl oxidase